MTDRDDITQLLNAAHAGDAAASAAVYRQVYDELRRCAQRQLRGQRGDATLSATALVNETYLRLAGHGGAAIKNRLHFFALCARAMRQIMVDHARRRHSAKRGGAQWHTELDAALEVPAASADRALDLDAALERLEARDTAACRIVEWHFFAGLSLADIAAELGQTEHSVRRDWELARAFLQSTLAAAPS